MNLCAMLVAFTLNCMASIDRWLCVRMESKPERGNQRRMAATLVSRRKIKMVSFEQRLLIILSLTYSNCIFRYEINDVSLESQPSATHDWPRSPPIVNQTSVTHIKDPSINTISSAPFLAGLSPSVVLLFVPRTKRFSHYSSKLH